MQSWVMSSSPPLAPDPAQPLGLVLSGGGARGAFQVGVYEVLLRHPRGLGGAPAVISGTSAGALNGALIAAGASPERMLEFWLELARKPPVVANDAFFRSLRAALLRAVAREPLRDLGRRRREVRIAAGLVRKHRLGSTSGWLAALLEFVLTARFDSVSDVLDSIATPYLFDTRGLCDRLRAVMGGPTLRPGPVRLALNAIDVHSGRVVRIVNAAPEKRPDASATHYRHEPAITAEMIVASASIPLLFAPVRVRGRELWDGGILVNTPIAPALALGARRIVPVLVTSARGEPPDEEMTMGRAIERLADTLLENAYNGDRKLLLERNRARPDSGSVGFHPVSLFRPIRPASSRTFNAGSYLFFERDALLAMYEAGRQAAREWLATGPLLDDRREE
jgi:NTE family protein